MDEDITDIGRYGADPSRLEEMRRKRLKSKMRKDSDDSDSESSSSSSQNSSSSSSSDDNEQPRKERYSNEGELERVKKEIMSRITQAAQAKVRPMTTDHKTEAEVLKLRATISKAVASNTVFLDDDDEDDEVEEMTIPRRKYKNLSEEESELDDKVEVVEEDDAEEIDEEEEEEEEEDFHLKFSFNGPRKVSANPQKPFKEAFEKFIKSLPPNLQEKKFVFKFDGQAIKDSQRPVDLDMDSGDQIDVIARST